MTLQQEVRDLIQASVRDDPLFTVDRFIPDEALDELMARFDVAVEELSQRGLHATAALLPDLLRMFMTALRFTRGVESGVIRLAGAVDAAG